MRLTHRLFAHLLPLLACAGIAHGQAVNLTVTPTSAVGSATPALSWSNPTASACTASGGWTGNKSPSSTQTLAAISATTSYTLTCTYGTGGTATVSFDAPTTNTDGTPYTDGAGFLVQYGTSASALNQTATVNSPTARSRDLTGLPSGTMFFATRAFNTAGRQSDLSNITSMNVTGTVTRSATVTVTITPSAPTTPNPPTNTRVVETTVFTLTKINGQTRLASDVGTAPLRTPCGPSPMPGFGSIERSKVKFTRAQPAAGVLLVARCG